MIGVRDSGGSCVRGCVHTERGKCRECGHVAELRCYRCGVAITAQQYDETTACDSCDRQVVREVTELGRRLLWGEQA